MTVVLLDLCIAASKSLKAIEMLSSANLERDALTIARSVFETAITARYLRYDPSQLPLYVGFTKVMRKKFLNQQIAQGRTYPAEVVAEADGEYATVAGVYGKELRWNKHQLKQMAEWVGLVDQYEEAYPILSCATHAGHMLVKSWEGEENSELADHLAFMYFALCLHELNEELRAGLDDEIQALLMV